MSRCGNSRSGSILIVWRQLKDGSRQEPGCASGCGLLLAGSGDRERFLPPAAVMNPKARCRPQLLRLAGIVQADTALLFEAKPCRVSSAFPLAMAFMTAAKAILSSSVANSVQ